MHWIFRGVLALLAAGLALVSADWIVWQLRVHAGHGFGSVTVSHVVVASLKGNREEYYPESTTEERCSRSLLPWGGVQSCWYLTRHRVQMDR